MRNFLDALALFIYCTFFAVAMIAAVALALYRPWPPLWIVLLGFASTAVFAWSMYRITHP